MTMEIFDCEQRSEQWFRCRMGIPTSSEFQCLLVAKGERKGRATYMRKLAGEIVTGEPQEGFTSLALERGKIMEAEARSAYALIHDADPQLVGFIRNGDKGASPDALLGDVGLLEIKTQRPDILIETLKAGEFPAEHLAQCQGALWVAEREWLDLVVYYSKMPMFVRRLRRDEGYIGRLAGAVKEFNDELAEMVAWIRRYGMEAGAP
jgi:hypothetical protein